MWDRVFTSRLQHPDEDRILGYQSVAACDNICLMWKKFSESCSGNAFSVQRNSHQVVFLDEISWGHGCHRLSSLKLFALPIYWKCTGSFKKRSISEYIYIFSNDSGHIVELQFSVSVCCNIKSRNSLFIYTPFLHFQK